MEIIRAYKFEKGDKDRLFRQLDRLGYSYHSIKNGTSIDHNQTQSTMGMIYGDILEGFELVVVSDAHTTSGGRYQRRKFA